MGDETLKDGIARIRASGIFDGAQERFHQLQDDNKSTTSQACPHCTAGRKPVWQAETSEMVHRGWSGGQFSITVCIAWREKRDASGSAG